MEFLLAKVPHMKVVFSCWQRFEPPKASDLILHHQKGGLFESSETSCSGSGIHFLRAKLQVVFVFLCLNYLVSVCLAIKDLWSRLQVFKQLFFYLFNTSTLGKAVPKSTIF